MNYLDIANSSLLWNMAAGVIIFVFFLCLIFLLKAYKRGVEIGISKKVLKNTIQSSAIFSIVPSIPIILSLIAMVPVLGMPFPWLRLSVIGSAPYELVSAEIGANSMGLNGLSSDSYTSLAFSNSMWIMSIGIIWGMVYCIFFLKKFQSKLESARKKDETLVGLLIMALYFGMLSVFIGPPIVNGGLPLYTMLSSGFIMFILMKIKDKWNITWLSNFTLSISMISGMAIAVLIHTVGGI